MTTTTLTHTPWGWTYDVEELAEGVLRVTTPSHGGLKLSHERWNELPADVTQTMFNQNFAEEDCEEPIVRTLLGLGDDRTREFALTVAGYFERYTSALPHLRAVVTASHYHVVGYGAEPFGRFDTRVEAEAFASDGGVNRRDYGWLEAVKCEVHHNGKEDTT